MIIREKITIIVIIDQFSNFKLFSYIFSVLVWYGKTLFRKAVQEECMQIALLLFVHASGNTNKYRLFLT